MSAHNEQNGRHATFPVQSVAPTDPRLRNFSSTAQDDFCRDYVWGICKKHRQCRYRHECSLEEMKSVIKFCHDHQNKQRCERADCTYLHTSSEEENLFLTMGVLPRVLLERHAAMNAAANSMATVGAVSMENASALYVAQPPPPPPPPITVAAPPPPPPPQIVPTVMPPPPPPPPTESSPIYTAPPPLYTAPPPQPPRQPPPPVFHLNQPPPPLPRQFDASMPPPPLPNNIRNGSLKRSMADACEAGPSKQRKPDDGKVAESLCDLCIQRELSIKLCTDEMNNLIRQTEYKKLLYKSKTEESEYMKAMMRLLLPAELRLAIEECMGSVQSQPSSVQPLGLSVPMQLMMSRLMEDRISNSSPMIDSMQSSSIRELLIGYLLNSPSSPERSSLDLRPSEILSANMISCSTSSMTSNGFSRLMSSQRPPAPAPVVTAAPAVAAAPTPAPSVTRPVYASTPSAPRPYPNVAAPAPPPYPPPYQPAVPPPTVRPIYPTYTVPPTPAPAPQATPPAPMPYSSASRASMPPPQPPPGPSTSAPMPSAPPNGHNYAPFMMGGYNSQHYYPPFQ